MNKKRYLTSRRLDEIWEQTSACYTEATHELNVSTPSLRHLYYADLITQQEFRSKIEEIDELYRLKLCELSTDVIEDIIRAHDRSIQIRAKKTIETLTTELITRQLLDEEERPS